MLMKSLALVASGWLLIVTPLTAEEQSVNVRQFVLCLTAKPSAPRLSRTQSINAANRRRHGPSSARQVAVRHPLSEKQRHASIWRQAVRLGEHRCEGLPRDQRQDPLLHRHLCGTKPHCG